MAVNCRIAGALAWCLAFEALPRSTAPEETPPPITPTRSNVVTLNLAALVPNRATCDANGTNCVVSGDGTRWQGLVGAAAGYQHVFSFGLTLSGGLGALSTFNRAGVSSLYTVLYVDASVGFAF